MFPASACDVLACPHCGAPLQLDGRRLVCPARHSFDIARQGYVNLLGGAGTRGLTPDDADMVAAREQVQSSGLYSPIRDALVAAVSGPDPLVGDLPPGAVLDVGGGTGYYAAGVLDALPDRVGIGLDLSVPAARRAARAPPRLASVVADTWARIPVQDEHAALVTCVFAPRDPEGFARVLAPGGAVAVVTPGPDHLAELVTALDLVHVDPDKRRRLGEAFARFEPLGTREVTTRVRVDVATAVRLALMGPAARHVDAQTATARVAAHAGADDRLDVTIDVRVDAFGRGRPTPAPADGA